MVYKAVPFPHPPPQNLLPLHLQLFSLPYPTPHPPLLYSILTDLLVQQKLFPAFVCAVASDGNTPQPLFPNTVCKAGSSSCRPLQTAGPTIGLLLLLSCFLSDTNYTVQLGFTHTYI